MTETIHEVYAANDRLGEGPFWDAGRRRLLWSDVHRSTVHELDPATGESRDLAMGQMVFSLVLNKGGGLIITGPTGMHHWHPERGASLIVREHEGESLFFNDAIADACGRVYAGTVYWGAEGLVKPGKLYLVDVDGKARIVDTGISMSNGLGFSPDDRTLYLADSLVRRIYAHDVDPVTGDLSGKRVFAQVPADEGMPDGLTVDAEGYVWSAQWYGGQVVRYDPEGNVNRRIAFPVTQVASVMFGGANLDELFVTTAAAPFKSDYAPPGYDHETPNLGGSLYSIRPGVRGRLEHLADLRLPS